MLGKKLFSLLVLALSLCTAHGQAAAESHVTLQLIRNATVKVTYGDTTILVDPMLAEPGAYPGFPNTWRSELRNPLTPLPMPVIDVLKGVDAVGGSVRNVSHFPQ